MKENEKEDKVVALNKELPEFFVEELEQRLETDPLMLSGVFNLQSEAFGCIGQSTCNGDGGCTDKSHCGIQW
ncbi:hypothetical protein [Bacteroides sp.]|uniref:hypothetical protein n=1 Tax=Bacteroides sp. TaxID=29523 RepID=UPI00262415CF|nr:hypothetical protein [Bacteroides sp.]